MRRSNFQNSHQRNQRSSRGAALIVVLMIFAATTVLVTQLQRRTVQSVNRYGIQTAQIQARAFAIGAERYAKIQLSQNRQFDQENQQTHDYAQEAWAQAQLYPIDGGRIQTQLYDLQGRFNLNELPNNTAAQAAFLRLLTILDIPSDQQMPATDLMQAILDWIDLDQEQQGFIEAEDGYYEQASQVINKSRDVIAGYKTASQPLSHLSELLLVRGMSAVDYAKLWPEVTLLPIGTKLNINSLTPLVAQAVSPQGLALLQARPVEGFTDQDLAQLGEDIRPTLAFGVQSEFFEARIQVDLADQRYRSMSLLYSPISSVVTPGQSPAPTNQAGQSQLNRSNQAPVYVLNRDSGWAHFYEREES